MFIGKRRKEMRRCPSRIKAASARASRRLGFVGSLDCYTDRW